MVHNPPIQLVVTKLSILFFSAIMIISGASLSRQVWVDFTSCSIEIGRRILDGFHGSTPRDEATVRFMRAGHLWERCGEKGVLGCERFFLWMPPFLEQRIHRWEGLSFGIYFDCRENASPTLIISEHCSMKILPSGASKKTDWDQFF